MSEIAYRVELTIKPANQRQAIVSRGKPVDFLRDVFNLLQRLYGFNDLRLKHIMTVDLLKALSDNDINYLSEG